MTFFGKKEPEVNSEGREYGHQTSNGPFSDEDRKHMTDLIEEIGKQEARGFAIVVKRKTIEKDDEHEAAEIDGIVKVSKVNRKFMLDTIFHAFDMGNKEIIEYVKMRTVVGSDFDDVTHGGH